VDPDGCVAEFGKRTKEFMRIMRLLGSLILLGSCRVGDRTITRGADGDQDWARRLTAAVPLGTSADLARATMESNGFSCRVGQESGVDLWCDKTGAQRGLVQRHWRAVFKLERGQVTQAKASTDLLAP
jgi:hypothetical protein